MLVTSGKLPQHKVLFRGSFTEFPIHWVGESSCKCLSCGWLTLLTPDWIYSRSHITHVKRQAGATRRGVIHPHSWLAGEELGRESIMPGERVSMMAIKASELLWSAQLNTNGLGLEKPWGVALLGAGECECGLQPRWREPRMSRAEGWHF